VIELLHHHFHEPVSGGTVFNVLFEHVHVIDHPALGVVGKTSTVAWTYSIDAAFIVGQVKELAGLTFIQPIALAVFIQPFFAESFGAHIQVSRYTLNIGVGIGGRHGFAAIGAGKTICFLPYGQVGLRSLSIQSAGWILFDPRQEAPESRPVRAHYSFIRT
jgi:hypothetical protein